MTAEAIVQRSRERHGRSRPDDRHFEAYRRHYILGESQTAIAESFGVTRSRICRMIQRTDKWVIAEFQAEVRDFKILHTRRLEHLYAESVQAWERSKQPAEKVEVTTDGEPTVNQLAAQPVDQAAETYGPKRKHTTTYRDGTHEFLAAAREALKDIRKIWGADAPAKVAPVNEDGSALTLATFLGLAAAGHNDGPPPNVIDVDQEYARLASASENGASESNQLTAQPVDEQGSR